MSELNKLAELLGPKLNGVLENFNIYNVLTYGAVADNSTNNLTAFQTAAAKVTSRAGTILIPTPANTSATEPSLKLYRLPNGRWLEDGLGTAADEIPGGTTDLRFRLGLESGPLIVPHGHRVVGQGGYPRDTTSPVGSEIWALAAMTRRLEVTALSSSGTTVTVEAKNHGLTSTQSVTVAGATNGAFNGTFPVTVTDWDTFTYTSSSFTGSATGPYTITTTVNPRVVQLGPSNNTAGLDSSRLEKLTINGRNVTGAIGVWTDCAQENSGIYDSAIIGCYHGIVTAAAGGIVPANFYIERNHIVLSSTAGNQGDGIQIFGGKLTLNKNSVICRATVATGDSGYVLRGSDHIAKNLHFEGFDYGLTIGGPDTGTPNDTGVWDYNITVDNLHGVNSATQQGLIAAARIRNDSTSVFNVSLSDITINSFRKGAPWAAGTAYVLGDRRSISTSSTVLLECTTAGTSDASALNEPVAGTIGGTVVDGTVTWTYRHLNALVIDEVNGINIPSNSSASHLQLGYYRFGGTMGVNAGSATKRPVFTSYYDNICPGGAVKALASANALDRTFTGGALAQVLQINGSTTIQTIGTPFPGAVVYLDIQSGAPTIDHQSASGTATERIVTSTGADITNAAGRYRAIYGGDPLNADRWYLEAV